MKKAFYWILVVALACSVGVFSACTKADVAPSILHIMGLEQPTEMTGKSLLRKK